MSQSSIPNRSGLFAAATAIGAAALLTIPAPAQSDPTIPLAPACNDFRFNGLFSVHHEKNGWIVEANTDDHTRLRGSAFAYHLDEGLKPDMHLDGTVDGTLMGREIEFTTRWNNGSVGVYRGIVYENGNVYGTNFDESHPEATDTWYSTGPPLECAPPGTEPPPTGPVPEDAPAIDMF